MADCNCKPEERTGGGHATDCPEWEPECTCYELTGGHQPGCFFNSPERVAWWQQKVIARQQEMGELENKLIVRQFRAAMVEHNRRWPGFKRTVTSITAAAVPGPGELILRVTFDSELKEEP